MGKLGKLDFRSLWYIRRSRTSLSWKTNRNCRTKLIATNNELCKPVNYGYQTKTDQHNKQAKSTISNNIDIDDIEKDIEYVLENVACLGKAAHREYTERMKQFLVLSIQKVVMQERIRVMQTERAAARATILDIAEQAEEADLSIDAVINAIKMLDSPDSTHN